MLGLVRISKKQNLIYKKWGWVEKLASLGIIEAPLKPLELSQHTLVLGEV